MLLGVVVVLFAELVEDCLDRSAGYFTWILSLGESLLVVLFDDDVGFISGDVVGGVGSWVPFGDVLSTFVLEHDLDAVWLFGHGGFSLRLEGDPLCEQGSRPTENGSTWGVEKREGRYRFWYLPLAALPCLPYWSATAFDQDVAFSRSRGVPSWPLRESLAASYQSFDLSEAV